MLEAKGFEHSKPEAQQNLFSDDLSLEETMNLFKTLFEKAQNDPGQVQFADPLANALYEINDYLKRKKVVGYVPEEGEESNAEKDLSSFNGAFNLIKHISLCTEADITVLETLLTKFKQQL